MFLIYINDLTKDLSTNAKLFADDTSLFSVIHDIQTFANNLNENLEGISNWDTQWKMSFNPQSYAKYLEWARGISKADRARRV